MSVVPYTLASYRVRPGQVDEFTAAWKELAGVFAYLPEPPLWGTLVRSTTDPTLFYSFGPWREPAHVKAMRTDTRALEAFRRLGAYCTEISPGNYELVEHVDVGAGGKG